MEMRSHRVPRARRIPTWVLTLLPLVAVVISNTDIVLLTVVSPRAGTGGMATALATTIPLSLTAGWLTLWLILRLRREVDRRALAEHDLRKSMADLHLALDREHLLHRELDHRVRNNLSALLSLVGMYEETDAPTKDIMFSLRSKILALRESYCLIAATHGDGIELHDLLTAVVTAILGSDDSKAINISGPSVKLTSREANAYSIIVQELLTNAAKHGALKKGGGTIGITWESAVSTDRARVALHWTEQPVEVGDKTPIQGQCGIGLSLIEGFATCDLRGSVACKKVADQWSVELIANLKLPSAADVVSPATT